MRSPLPLLTLQRAVDLVGGVEALAQEIEIPAGDLELMLQSSRPVSTLALLRVVDLLIAADQPPFISPPLAREEDQPK